MTTGKNEVFIELLPEICYLVKALTFVGGQGGKIKQVFSKGKVYWGDFPGRENEQIFGQWGESTDSFNRKPS